MKKLSSIIVCCAAICIGNTSAMGEMYKMDATTAASMRLLDVSTGDSGSLLYVGYNPGGSGDKVFGSNSEYVAGAGNMTYAVGFSGNVTDDETGSGLVQLTIGLSSPGLSGTYDGFELSIANDDDDIWNYRAYVKTADGTTYYSAWTVGVASGSNQTLFVSTLGLNYENVTSIGFEIEYDRSLNGGRAGDDYAVSVVPVPGAILLGMLGISVVGMKLRRFA